MVKYAGPALFALLGLGACQHTTEATPAMLADTSDANLSALKSALAETMGHSRVDLGAGDLAQMTRVSVLPPALSPNDDRSPALPTYFDLMMRDGTCVAVHSETKTETLLPNVTCQPAT